MNTRNNNPKSRFHRHSFGIALAFIGLPIAWIFRDIAGFNNSQAISIGFLSLSLLLTLKSQRLLKVISFNKKAWLKFIPLFFLIPAMMAAFYVSDMSNLAYMTFALLFWAALNTLTCQDINFLPKAFIGVGFLTCLLIIIFVLSSGYTFEPNRLQVGSTNSPGFVGYVASLSLSSSFFLLFRKNDSAKKNIFYLLAKFNLIICTLVLVATFSRSQYLGLALTSIYLLSQYLFRSNIGNKKYYLQRHEGDFHLIKNQIRVSKTKIIRLTLILGIFFLMLLAGSSHSLESYQDIVVSTALNFLEKLSELLTNGFQTIIGKSSSDMSALTRYNNITYALDNLTNSGHGYMSLWIDSPVLQSYYDGGLLGFFVFFSITILIPLFLIVRSLLNSIKFKEVNIFCCSQYLAFSPILFLHGHPYSFFPWINIILFYSVFHISGSKKDLAFQIN